MVKGLLARTGNIATNKAAVRRISFLMIRWYCVKLNFYVVLSGLSACVRPVNSVYLMQVMPHALLFGVHVESVVLVGFDLQWHILRHLQSITFKTDPFHGVVGHEPHLLYAEGMKDICPTP